MKFNNLLVVDDDKVHHFIIKKLLEKNDIQVNMSFFENGHDALHHLKSKLKKKSNSTDLILLDINMPVLDGWQFLEEFKEIQKDISSEIIIYVVSSSDSSINEDRIEEFKDVIENYFVKPMTSEMIKTIFLT
ncbi:response regulator [Flavobacterium sp.]|uniref:response regulator n=1 Tax=Flavobacterium sp. TaxID=239 RepID=UPI002FD90DC9